MTAELVCPPGTPEADWLAARRDGIGASEMAAVLNCSPYQSRFGLYWAKVKGWELADSADMEAGRRAEPMIADWFYDIYRAEHDERLVLPHAGLWRSTDRPWQLATPDRLVCTWCPDCDGHAFFGPAMCQGCRGTGRSQPYAVLECKHPYDWHGFGEPWTADIPLHFQVQVQQQCDVMGLDRWFLAAYAAHEFRIYRGNRDADDIRTIREFGGRFWDQVQRREQPDVDEHTATLATLKRLHPSVEDREAQVDLAFAEGYRRARALRDRAAALVDRYDNRARHLLGPARRLMCGRQLVVSRSVYERRGEDYDVVALDEGYPTTDRLNPGRARSYVGSN